MGIQPFESFRPHETDIPAGDASTAESRDRRATQEFKNFVEEIKILWDEERKQLRPMREKLSYTEQSERTAAHLAVYPNFNPEELDPEDMDIWEELKAQTLEREALLEWQDRIVAEAIAERQAKGVSWSYETCPSREAFALMTSNLFLPMYTKRVYGEYLQNYRVGDA